MEGDVVHEWDTPYPPGDIIQLLPNGNLLAALDPEDPEPLIWQSLLLTLRQSPEEAVEKAREAVGIAPYSASALSALCMALEWDGANLKVTNCPEAEQFVRREYRSGWTL